MTVISGSSFTIYRTLSLHNPPEHHSPGPWSASQRRHFQAQFQALFLVRLSKKNLSHLLSPTVSSQFLNAQEIPKSSPSATNLAERKAATRRQHNLADPTAPAHPAAPNVHFVILRRLLLRYPKRILPGVAFLWGAGRRRVVVRDGRDRALRQVACRRRRGHW